MGAYHKGEAGAVLGSARTQFEAIVTFLKSDEAAAMNHAELEERLQVDGRELLRRMYRSTWSCEPFGRSEKRRWWAVTVGSEPTSSRARAG